MTNEIFKMIRKCFNSLKPHQTLSLCHYSKTELPLSPLSLTKTNNLSPKEQSLLSLLKRCSTMREMNQVHSHIIRNGFDQSLYLVGKIIVFYAISDVGSMDYAVSVFEMVENPDGFLWNTMIRGFSKRVRSDKAFDYYKRMIENGELPDSFTLSFLLKACGQLRFVWLGKQFHCCAIKLGFGKQIYVRSSMVHMYGMVGEIEIARQVFDEIRQPGLVAWNIIIDCYVHCGDYKKASELFYRMMTWCVKPDETTLVVTLTACSGLGNLDFGRWVHSIIRRVGLVDSLQVCNALIDMYAKCGAMEEAFSTFDDMRRRDIVTWNSVIRALADHGDVEGALLLFERLLRDNIEKPNDVTFLGVLYACSHGGMVEKGKMYFNIMINDYQILPSIKHYGCMVDLLARAGLLDEAYELIKGMPMQCNAVVYRTLLGACRLHGNVKLGEKLRRHLMDLEPENSSDYVLLANMYASKGKWDDVARIRRSMDERGVQKPEPGNSWHSSSSVVEANQVFN